MNSDNGENNFSIIQRPTSSVDKAEARAKRVLATIVADTLAIAQNQQILTVTTNTQSEADKWLQEGRSLYLAKDFEEAVKWFCKAAEHGNAEAQNFLGVCYSNGEGVTKNPTDAAIWHRKAAEQGFAKAQYNLGLCYESGEGVQENDEEAVTWHLKAAEQGISQAQRKLFCIYDKDRLGPLKEFWDAVVKWVLAPVIIPKNEIEKRARNDAEQGDSELQCILGWCYFCGTVVPQNNIEAVTWYLKAAEHNHAVAQWHLGLCYEYGIGVRQDYREAYKWLKLALAEKDINVAALQLKWITSKMTQDQIREAERRYAEYKAGHQT